MSPSMKLLNEKYVGPRDHKVSARQAASGGLGVSAYTPSSGSFHLLESLSLDSEAGYLNGRVKSIDELDDTSSSHGGGADMDCMSINGSSSGDSEDQPHTSSKDKILIAKPGDNGTDSKREKIRGKNERKHRRQKERRAQELRERCHSYLMSRKLECLSQKLVAMGFSNERATMALIVNNGQVEQSVAWLLEGGEGQLHKDWSPSGNLKLDISEEMQEILEMEKKYKVSRTEIERAVVSYDGDLEKALNMLQASNVCTATEGEHKTDVRAINVAHPGRPSVLLDGTIACQPKGSATVKTPHQLGSVMGPFFDGRLVTDSPTINSEILKNPARMQQTEPQHLVTGVERRLPSHFVPMTNSNIERTEPQSFVTSVGRQATTQSVPMKTSIAAPSFMPASSSESSLVFGFGMPDARAFTNSSRNTPAKEFAENRQGGSRQFGPQVISTPKNVSNTVSTLSSSKVIQKGLMEVSSPSSVLHVHDERRMKGLATYKPLFKGSELSPGDLADRINALLAIQMESQGLAWNNARNGLSREIASLSSSPLPTFQSGSSSESSRGLFTGWSGGAQQSPVDWTSGGVCNYDYKNIDWSMNVVPGVGTQVFPNQANSSMPQVKWGCQWDMDSSRTMQTTARTSSVSSDRIVGGSFGAKFQDNTSKDIRNSVPQDWTSPFTGKSLFNLEPSVSSLFL